MFCSFSYQLCHLSSDDSPGSWPTLQHIPLKLIIGRRREVSSRDLLLSMKSRPQWQILLKYCNGEFML